MYTVYSIPDAFSADKWVLYHKQNISFISLLFVNILSKTTTSLLDISTIPFGESILFIYYNTYMFKYTIVL